MQIWLGVENFAKIESARVCINNYTLFVGPNNSGKTFLMQLIQGMGNRIAAFADEKAMEALCVEKVPEYSKFILSSDNISQLVAGINNRLNEEKENIVKMIFGKDIPIGKLYIDISMEDSLVYEIYSSANLDNLKKLLKNDDLVFFDDMFSEMFALYKNNYVIKKCNKFTKTGIVKVMGRTPHLEEIKLFRSILNDIIGCNSLCLPVHWE